jgi:O-antigen ligase
MAQRIPMMLESGETKLALYANIWQAITDYPLTGLGYGSFSDAFPVYSTAEIGYGGHWNAAHNIYLEAAFGLGLPAAGILFASIAWCIWRCLMGAFKRRRDATAPIAAITAALVVTLHGVVDFSIQSPAVAFTFAAMVGCGCAQSWTHDERVQLRRL